MMVADTLKTGARVHQGLERQAARDEQRVVFGVFRQWRCWLWRHHVVPRS